MIIKGLKPGFCFAFILLISNVYISFGQFKTDTLINAKTNNFFIQLHPASQTLSSLLPADDTSLNFIPTIAQSEKPQASKNHSTGILYEFGDINIASRNKGTKDWNFYSSAESPNAAKKLNTTDSVFAAADLSNCFTEKLPLDIQRFWIKNGNNFSLRFVLRNNSDKPVEIGYIGVPMIFNNLLRGEDLETAHKKNVFYDAYTGMDAGYLQVTRLNGLGPELLVLPEANTPFEAYNPLLKEALPRSSDFEGFYEWVISSRALYETSWSKTEQWNDPSSFVLQPGASRTIGFRFVTAPSIKKIEETLSVYHRPVAVGLPGYVLPKNVTGNLFIKYDSKISSIKVYPENALIIKKAGNLSTGWTKWILQGNKYGKARITIQYENGLIQTIHYKIIESESQTIKNYGHFLSTNQWFDTPDTIFHRNPSFISYDDELHQQVTQNNRAWIAGLSDEGGAGSWLGMMMKQFVIPDKNEIALIEKFIDSTLWGGIQYKSGDLQYGVRKSFFYYEPDSLPKGTYNTSIDFKTWSAWPLKEAASVGRSYNYPHVAAGYWVMYRLARNHQGLVANHQWKWYLEQAYHTSMAMVNLAPYYTQFGQMEGTIFYMILKDLKEEGMHDEADILEAAMKKRAIHWSQLSFPFGSEMPWDSTGQEEVFIWSLYFGFEDKANETIQAILGYMPTIPSWAYNGNARRYWDFLYAGKLQRVERMIHHYGSELNAIPLLTYYRLHPDDFYTLRVAYGGVLGGISNIQENGFAPLAFHSFPNTLKEDGYSGDYGSGFFGYAINTATYLIHHPDFGWVAFGGNSAEHGDWINVQITTAAQNKIFIAPAKLWITLDAGKLDEVSYNQKTGEIKILFAPLNSYTSNAVLRIENPGVDKVSYKVKGYSLSEKEAYVISLSAEKKAILLSKISD